MLCPCGSKAHSWLLRVLLSGGALADDTLSGLLVSRANSTVCVCVECQWRVILAFTFGVMCDSDQQSVLVLNKEATLVLV